MEPDGGRGFVWHVWYCDKTLAVGRDVLVGREEGEGEVVVRNKEF